MARIKVPSGTIQKFEEVFDDLQNFIKANEVKKFKTIVQDTFGINFEMSNGQYLTSTVGSSLKVGIAATGAEPTKYTIQPGKAFVSTGDIIDIEDIYTVSLIAGADVNSFYAITLQYTESGSDSLTAMNAFLYDSGGSTPYSTKYSRYADAYAVVTAKLDEASGFQHIAGNNSFTLAIVKTDNTGKLLETAFTFTDQTQNNKVYTALNGVIDVRAESRLLLDSQILDDSKVVLKDRDSTAGSGGAIDANVEITKDLTVGDDVSIGDDLAVNGKITVVAANDTTVNVGMQNSNLLTGVPLQIANQGTAMSLSGGGTGHIAHFWGDNSRITMRDRSTGIMELYHFRPSNQSFLEMSVGGSENHQMRITSDAKVVMATVDSSQPAGDYLHTDQLQEGERLGLDKSLMFTFKNQKDDGIIWRKSNYAKQSMKIIPVDTHGFSRGGLGFFTNNAQDNSTPPTLRMAISKKGSVIIGIGDPNYQYIEDSYNVKLLVTGNSWTTGFVTAGRLESQGNLDVTGITNLTGTLTADVMAYFKGGIDVKGPFTVSGLTAAGTFYSEIGIPDTNFIRFHKSTAAGTLLDKGSIHLDGLSRAIMNLNDENNIPWYSATPSGVYYNTNDFAIGTTTHPNSSFYGNTLTVMGEGPSLILRNTSNVNFGADKSLGAQNQDWFLGSVVTGGQSGDFAIGKFTNPNTLQKFIDVKSTGAIGLCGESADDEFRLKIGGGTFINGDSMINGTFMGPAYRWPIGTGDASYSAGITNQGTMTLGAVRQTNVNLAVGGYIHSFPSPEKNMPAGFSVGGTVNSAQATLEWDDTAATVLLKKGADVMFEAGAETSGMYMPFSTITNLDAADANCTTLTAGLTNFTDTVTTRSDVNILDADLIISGGFQGAAKVNFDGVHASDISISGITNEEFYVGVGKLGTNFSGLKVLTEAGTATEPQNIRIYDVKPSIESEYEGRSQVVVDWNYSNIQGTGGNPNDDWFTPNDGIAAYQDSKGVNPTEAEFLKIIGKRFVLKDQHGVHTYTIDDANFGTGAIMLARYHNEVGEQGDEYLGENSVGPEHGKVTEECDHLEINFLEVGSDGVHNPADHTSIFSNVTDDYIEENRFMTYLQLGKKWSIRMRTVRGTKSSPWQSHATGQYDPDHSDPYGSVSGQSIVTYTTAFNNVLPMLEDNGSVGLQATNFGFQVTVAGWSHPEDNDKNPHFFDIAYTTNDVVDFNISDNTTLITTAGRTYDINTTVSTEYAVAVRPKQNGQVVGLVKTNSVTSGAGGVPPSYTNYLSKDIACDYYRVDLDTGNSNNFTIGAGHVNTVGDNLMFFSDGGVPFDLQVLDTPNFTAATISGIQGGEETIPHGARFEVFSVDGASNNPVTSFGTSFTLGDRGILEGGRLQSIYANNTAANGFNANSEDGYMSGYNDNSHILILGGSKWTRRLAEVTINQDIDIKQATIFVEFGTRYTPASPCIIRVYQQGHEADAGTMMVKTAFGETSQAMNVQIRASQGQRKIIVDAWDPSASGANNKGSIKGTLNLYGQPGMDIDTDNQQTN